MQTPVFSRVLLKISGEALAANQGFGVDPLRIHEIAAELADVHTLGVQIAIVVGGGNFFRGVAEQARVTCRRRAGNLRETRAGGYRRSGVPVFGIRLGLRADARD